MDIIPKKDTVITSFIVPYILGYGIKTREEAKRYIKHGETLNPNYYPRLIEKVKKEGMNSVIKFFNDELFNTRTIDNNLSEMFGETVYRPWDCLSFIHQITLNDKMGLVARPDGVTMNNETIIMVNNYFNKIDNFTKKILETQLIATMAVWNAKKGIVLLTKNKSSIRLDFDAEKWDTFLNELIIWSDECK